LIGFSQIREQGIRRTGYNEGSRAGNRENVVTLLNLIISIVFIAVNFWAISRIVEKASLSRLWLLLPLVSVGLTIGCAIDTYSKVHGAPAIFLSGIFGWSQLDQLWHEDFISVGYRQGGLLWHIDLISFGANWLLFVFFAVVPWGSDRGLVKVKSEAKVTGSLPPTRPATAPTQGARGVTRDYGSASSSPTTVAAPAPSSTAPTVKHCVWCAEALPGSRALFHDCGPKSRPPIFCQKCGSTLTAVGDCASCSA
jgi:hypothetical protein